MIQERMQETIQEPLAMRSMTARKTKTKMQIYKEGASSAHDKFARSLVHLGPQSGLFQGVGVPLNGLFAVLACDLDALSLGPSGLSSTLSPCLGTLLRCHVCEGSGRSWPSTAV